MLADSSMIVGGGVGVVGVAAVVSVLDWREVPMRSVGSIGCVLVLFPQVADGVSICAANQVDGLVVVLPLAAHLVDDGADAVLGVLESAAVAGGRSEAGAADVLPVGRVVLVVGLDGGGEIALVDCVTMRLRLLDWPSLLELCMLPVMLL